MSSAVKQKTFVQLTLRHLREKLGMTQQQFSEAFGVTMITVCRWETSRPPSGHNLADLAGFARVHGMVAAAGVFEKALAEDPRKNRHILWPQSAAQTALREIYEEREYPSVRQAYVRALRAIKNAHDELIERALEDGIDTNSCWTLERTNQELERELDYAKKRTKEKP
jgi:transcriptional regulator with XRE-family HTH domain